MKTKLLNETELDIAAKMLQNGEIVAFPTETVFGLGVIFDDNVAYERLVAAKKRPADKPFTLMCATINQIEEAAIIDDDARKIIDKFMPGAITLLLRPKKNLPFWVTLGLDTIGVRIPNHNIALELIKKTGKPLLVPSANVAGEPPAITIDEVIRSFDNVIAGIVTGDTNHDLPSTIIDLTIKPVKLIREGSISFKEINDVLEEK